MAQETIGSQLMSSRTRRLVLWISAPVVAFAILGGVLDQALAREDTYRHLKIFDDVVDLITDNYVEKVDVDRVMSGAMQGLADSLDPDSAYLTANQVKQIESGAALPAGDVGLDLTRQYYLRIIAARDGSPAARAGLRTGDYIRAINDKSTREMSVFEGLRLLRGAPGSTIKLTVFRGNASEPHDVELRREILSTVDVTSRIAAAGVGYVRIAAIGPKAADQVRSHVADLTKSGAASLVIDVRRTSGGSLESGVALARLFIASGTLTLTETKGLSPQPITARRGDGAVTLPTTVLVDTGTTAAAELFAAAVAGNKRGDLVGEHTLGRVALQTLVKLPDGSGLWLTTTRYLMPDGTTLHQKGLEPTLIVEQPQVEFGAPPPDDDPVLEKALQRASARKAA
jgi:carboxyl-terminal processing protease